ncbi:MAG: excinuclease ABC subunit UvrC [Clostridiales bacterium]|nr:excinuclease ABC subunit UvrC [Clostridiales bacterium]
MSNNKFDARLDTVPLSPGVYLMKDASGTVIYVGKAKKLRNRLRSYFGGGHIAHPKVAAMVSHVADFEYVVVGTEAEALLLEANLIKRHMPQYNILLRDDKSYPYACITLNEEYPRVFKAFRPDEKARKAGARYFGPYMNGDLYNTMKTIEEIFPLKRCRKVFPRDIGKDRPCLNYHIGKCMAPCSGNVSAEEYRKMIFDIVAFFEGRYDGIKKTLTEQMEEASGNLDFERAAVLRDRLAALNGITEGQRVFQKIERDVDAVGIYSQAGETCVRKLELRSGRIVGSSTYFMKGDLGSVTEILTGFITQYYPGCGNIPPMVLIPQTDEKEDADLLGEFLSAEAGRKVRVYTPERGEMSDLLKMASLNAQEMMVRRILRGGGAEADPSLGMRLIERLMSLPENSLRRAESYDISNLGNDDICSGMVVFKDGRPDRQSYRLFKMKTVETQDDFASMRETLTRRFAHDEKDGFEYPDLILVDGGKGQLSAVASVVRSLDLNRDIKLAGMVKNNKHRTAGLLLEDGTLYMLDKPEPSDDEIVLLRFLSAVQNEVHRYAITYQKKLMKKRNIRYKLENITGIGPSKRKILLSELGSIKAVEDSDIETLSSIKGISAKDAKMIYEYFHGREDEQA